MEPYHQDEHVTEADMVRRSMSNPRPPIIHCAPTMANEVWRRAGIETSIDSRPLARKRSCGPANLGSVRSLQSVGRVSSVVRHVKGSEGDLTQRRNCYVSNTGTGGHSLRGRRVDRQWGGRGSEAVVVGGVTSTRGGRESRSQGEGPYITRRDMTISRGRTSRRHMEMIYAQRG